MLPSIRNISRLFILLITCAAFAEPLAINAAGKHGSESKAVPHTITWQFDRTGVIGGQHTQVLGHPHVIETLAGKAVEFNGVDDALIIPQHPLAGASSYTWEVIFRPDGGAFAQRFFHL